MESESSVCIAKFSITLKKLYILSAWFRNDIARSIWTLYVISTSVRVEQCMM